MLHFFDIFKNWKFIVTYFDGAIVKKADLSFTWILLSKDGLSLIFELNMFREIIMVLNLS